MDKLSFALLRALREREHLAGTEDWRILDAQRFVDYYINQARAEERERACRIVRKNCAACNGTGYGQPEQHPSGEGWVRTECEYCGHTISAIRKVEESGDA